METVDGMVVVEAGTVDIEADGMEDTMAVAGTGMPDTIGGTEDGAGGEAAITRGGCFFRLSFRFLILTMEDITVPAMATDMVRATGTDMDTEPWAGEEGRLPVLNYHIV
jgi:hypothetical protein